MGRSEGTKPIIKLGVLRALGVNPPTDTTPFPTPDTPHYND